jgi:predicted transcriptional regulator
MLSNEEIIEKIKSLYRLKSDSDAGRLLGASKQSISQYLKKSGVDVNNKIISKLIEDIETGLKEGSVGLGDIKKEP